MLPQGFTGQALQALVDSKQIDTSALPGLRMTLPVATTPVAEPSPSLSWIAGPVIGGLVGIALVGGVCWFLYTRYYRADVPVSSDGNGTDAAVRIRRASDKYRTQQAQPTAVQVRVRRE